MAAIVDEKKRERLELGNNESEFLILSVAGQLFGVNVSKVLNISIWNEELLTKLPGSDGVMLGSIMFRDEHISAIDLSRYMDRMREPSERGSKRLVMATHFNGKTLGFIIDAVEGIERVSWKDFVPFNATFEGAMSSKINGTLTINDKIILIPDLEGIAGELDPSISIDSFEEMVEAQEIEASKMPRILYCEDSKIVQKVTLQSLQKAGFKDVTVCLTGKEGFELIKKREGTGEQFELIISDIEMPEMDGLTLCRETRRLSSMNSVPFVFFSSLINDQMKEECKRVGGDGAHSKPEIHNMVLAIKERFHL